METKDTVGLGLICISILMSMAGYFVIPEFREPVPPTQAEFVTLIIAIFVAFGLGIGLVISPQKEES